MGDTGNKDVFIEVPQGCYAVIKENSPSNIKGLLTTGLNICNCIIVTDKEHKNMVLAHVDGNHTNLLDKDHGLLSWIEQIPGKDVEIYYGIKSFIDANNHKEANEINKGKAEYYNNVYKDQIDYVLNLAETLGKNIEKYEYLDEVMVDEDFVATTAAIIYRNSNIIRNGDENDKTVISKEIENNKFEFLTDIKTLLSTQFLQNIQLIKDYNDDLENFQNQEFLKKQRPLFQLTYGIHGDKVIELNNPEFITENMPLPPVCCYNGIGQPKKFTTVWDCLNNKDYKNNMNAKIIEYCDILNSIYEKYHKNIINNNVIKEFKAIQKKLLKAEILRRLKILNNNLEELLNDRQNER